MSKDLFIVQGSAGELPELLREARADTGYEYQTLWTAPRTAKDGDRIFFYLLAPLSAVVGEARCLSDAFINNDFESHWFGKSMVIYGKLRMFTNYIGLHELRDIFPEWHWTRRPQGAIKIPSDFEKPFLELITYR